MKRKCFTVFAITLAAVVSLPPVSALDMYAGHFSREGNNQSPSEASNNNIYLKIFENRWIGLLYIPYPYAKSVASNTITQVFEQAKKQTTTSAYLRGEFGHLDQLATVQIERFGYLEDRLVFECGSLSPCTIKLYDNYLELYKPGMINEHIIKYNHVITAD
ncbi:MAG: hypothetical protein GY820_29300 [Gammaproteobacteria bacterium]|nr:hypothetical protein [Gammaproteobacteria bacterium]